MSENDRISERKSGAAKEERTSHSRKSNYSQPVNSSVDRILFLQRTIGNQSVGRLIRSRTLQAELKIGRPDDIYEQEADRIAEQVMRMPYPASAMQSSVNSRPVGLSIENAGCLEKDIQRKEDEDEEEGILSMKHCSQSCGAGNKTNVPPGVHEVLSSPGVLLDQDTRAYMEPRFGHDFSRVRVHSGVAAEQSAREVNAHAYTVGHNIVFGAGMFTPETQAGRHLIAHELTHVVQQTGNNILKRNTIDPMAHIAPVRQTITDSQIQRKWSLAGRKGAAGGWAGDATSSNNSIDETGICATLTDQHYSCAKSRAHTWQTRGFLKSSYGGRAKVFRWVTSEYTFKNDHTDNDFLTLSGKGSISGWAKAEDLDHARGAGLIVGRITENPHINRTSAQMFPPLKEGGISAASVGDLGEIEADVPIGSGSINIKINLTKVNEGTQVPINDNNSPSYNVPKSVDEVDVTIIVRVDADSDIEDEVWGGLLAAGDENTAKVVAGFYLDWQSRPESVTSTPLKAEVTEPGAEEEQGILEEKATCKNPPGCTPDRCRDLQKEVKRLCDRKRGCWEGMSCKVARTYVKKNEECANSRRKINDECFNGGDKGHKKAEGDARQAARNCKKIIKDGKCEEKEKY